MKKIISILLSIIMLLGSVNVVLAESTTANPNFTSICLRSNDTNHDVIYASNNSYYANKYVSFIKYDLTDYLPQVYLCDTITFSIKSITPADNMETPFDLSIVSDGLENYDSSTIKYSTAGDLLKDFKVIYHANAVGWQGTLHPTSDIKADIIDALQSGNNNTIVIKVSTSDNGSAYLDKASVTLNINYDTEVAKDENYYSLITSEFNFDNEANVSSNAIADDFTLPSFYKGSNITWTSDNAAISITDNNATVAQQLTDTTVKLTATFSYKENSSYTKDYTVTVAKKHILDVIANEFNNSYSLTSEPLDAVTTDVNLASSYNGAALTWSSSNINVVHPVTGKVYRPADADAIVSLTPTVSSDGESRSLNPINITVKKYDGKVETIIASDGDMATIYGNMNQYDKDQPDDYLYVAQGTTSGSLYFLRASFIKFDVGNLKDLIENADSLILNLHTATSGYSTAADINKQYDVYLVDDNTWDSSVDYYDVRDKMFKNTPAQRPLPNDEDLIAPIYSSPAGCLTSYMKYNTSNILPAVKEHIEANPTATEISFMILSGFPKEQLAFYGTAGNDAQKPSLEIRYNFETPSFEAVENTDGTYSAVIKTNDAIDGSYNVYFAAYSRDNTLVGIDVIPDVEIEAGATRINADAQKFVTQGATKIKCIITKADGITPLWKNDELNLG